MLLLRAAVLSQLHQDSQQAHPGLTNVAVDRSVSSGHGPDAVQNHVTVGVHQVHDNERAGRHTPPAHVNRLAQHQALLG